MAFFLKRTQIYRQSVFSFDFIIRYKTGIIIVPKSVFVYIILHYSHSSYLLLHLINLTLNVCGCNERKSLRRRASYRDLVDKSGEKDFNRNFYISMNVQRDATIRSLYFILLQDHSTCFGCRPHPSSGVHKTVVTATGTSHMIAWLSDSKVTKLATLE